MPTKIEFDFVAVVASAVANTRKFETGLKALSGEAKSVNQALDNAAKAGETFGNKGAIAAIGVQTARASIGAMMNAANAAGQVLNTLSQAFDQARAAAEKYGNTKVVDQIDAMHASIDKTIGVLLELPVAGRGVLDWMGGAAEGAQNLALLSGALSIQWKQFTGEIDAQTAAALAAKLVNDDYSKSLDAVYTSAGQAQAALQKMRREMAEEGKGAGNLRVVKTSAPGGGFDYKVIDTTGANFGTQGGGGMTQPALPPVTVNIQGGVFSGDKSTVTKLAEALAPELQKQFNRRPNPR